MNDTTTTDEVTIPKLYGDGGPAFPDPLAAAAQYVGTANFDTGMTLRDYFAMHAPDDPTWHFNPVMPSPRPEPTWAEDDNKDECALNYRDIEAWDNERSKQRMIQWPWVWADAMLKARQL